MNFNFEPLCCKNSRATLLLSKKYVIFFMFHGRKWRQMFSTGNTNHNRLKWVYHAITYSHKRSLIVPIPPTVVISQIIECNVITVPGLNAGLKLDIHGLDSPFKAKSRPFRPLYLTKLSKLSTSHLHILFATKESFHLSILYCSVLMFH